MIKTIEQFCITASLLCTGLAAILSTKFMQRQIRRFNKWRWKEGYAECPHNFTPAQYRGSPAKVCISCNTWMQISKQQFKHLFKISFSQVCENYRAKGKKLYDLGEHETV